MHINDTFFQGSEEVMQAYCDFNVSISLGQIFLWLFLPNLLIAEASRNSLPITKNDIKNSRVMYQGESPLDSNLDPTLADSTDQTEERSRSTASQPANLNLGNDDDDAIAFSL